MPRPTHYVPRIGRHLICALYHEAKHRRQPMTRLVEELLTRSLQGTPGWQIAQTQVPPIPDPHPMAGRPKLAAAEP